jgi:hypothetical protein
MLERFGDIDSLKRLWKVDVFRQDLVQLLFGSGEIFKIASPQCFWSGARAGFGFS